MEEKELSIINTYSMQENSKLMIKNIIPSQFKYLSNVYNIMQGLIAKMGRYKFDEDQGEDLSRIKKPLQVLKNGFKYEGEFLRGTNIRDGRGI